MRKNLAVLGALSMAAAAAQSSKINDFTEPIPFTNNGVRYMNPTIYNAFYGTQPIYIPKKHTKESYRSQQRRAKKRRFNK